jgi:WhiB family transcriptional regulator, redox-sensing transcriptional regulator
MSHYYSKGPQLDAVSDSPTYGEGWRERAACRGMGPDLFYADNRGHERDCAPIVRQAQAICARCPVRDECHAYALALPANQRVGIWGGVSIAQEVRRSRRTG